MASKPASPVTFQQSFAMSSERQGERRNRGRVVQIIDYKEFLVKLMLMLRSRVGLIVNVDICAINFLIRT